MIATVNEQDDIRWLRRALRLAQRGLGLCSPNPMVGAVVQRDGALLGEGYHQQAGGAHAEPLALAQAGEAACGATLYVTLEPCSTWGRTPPCCEAIIKAGIKRVVIGCLDQNPKHAGRGVEILRAAGIEVRCGVLEETCRQLNEAFFFWISNGRPFVCLKMAMTLDGRIATASGQSQWISGEAARRVVQKMRRGADAVMAGGDTVRQDDASLQVRMPARWPRQPLRVVWTSASSLPPELKMFHDGGPAPILAKPHRRAEWLEFLSALARRQERPVSSLLLEGGGELAAAALRAGVVNKVAFFVAPKLLGGRGSRPVLGGDNPQTLSEALELNHMRSRPVGDDLLITGYCKNVYRSS
jgi:diaminohydroxyphosphoribosylaminopyrimidine deaminase/5-amino-6-(5-phosphoribosylamino)uracil reductase